MQQIRSFFSLWRQRLSSVSLANLATPILLALLTFVVYWQPLCMHFWGGCDEHGCMADDAYDPVFEFKECWKVPPGGRPLAFYPLRTFGYFVSHDHVEGFIALALVLWLCNALLLRAILQRLFPETPIVGTAAAVLMIVHRSEPLRYWVMWSALYYLLPLFWLLAAVWLLLLSFERRSYLLLAAACAALAFSLLSMEGLFPAAVLGPVLLWLKRDALRPYWKWTAAWSATIAVCAVQFVRYLLLNGSSSYQARQAGDILHHPDVLFTNFMSKISTIGEYFHVAPPDVPYIARWILIAACAAAALVISAWGKSPPVDRKRLALVLGLGVVWMLFGILPFLHITGNYRTQFLAAPGQAIIVCTGLALLLCWLPRKIQIAGCAIVIATIASSSGIHSHKHQMNVVLGHPVSFQKTTSVFEHIEGLSPNLPHDTLVLFEIENPKESPLGLNYHVRRLGGIVLSVKAGQINYDDPIGETTKLTDDGVSYGYGHDLAEMVPYEKVLIFRLERTGAISLVTELPATFDPAARAAYRPLARLTSGKFAELRYLRPSPWLEPIDCITNGRDGVICGQGWEAAQRLDEDRYSRHLHDDAELIINPQNQQAFELSIDIVAPELPVEKYPITVSLFDESHALVATQPAIAGTVRFSVKLGTCAPTRLYLRSNAPKSLVTRIAKSPLSAGEASKPILVANAASRRSL